MNEWTVVTVIIAMVGLMAAIVKPIISLNSSITRLTAAVKNLEDNIASLTDKNSEVHTRLWLKNAELDEKICGHETRLQILEKTK